MGLQQELRNPTRDDALRALGIDPSLYARLADQEPGAGSDDALPLSEAIDLFESRHLFDGGSTARTYMAILRSFTTFIHQYRTAGLENVRSITGADVAAFATRPLVVGGKRHPNTTNRDLSVVSALFGFLVREGLLRRNPAELADRAQEVQSAPRALSEREQERLLDWSRKSHNALRNHTIIYLALNTGLRASEVCNLKWADIDLRKGRLHVVQGKGGRDRTVPLLPPMMEALVYYRQTRRYEIACPGYEDSVFLNSAGARWGCAMTVDGLEMMLWPLLRRLKKPKGANFHLLRHSFAVNLLWRGVHIAVIGALLGHRSFETTNRHLLLGDPGLKRALTEACPDGVLVPSIRRELNREHLSSLVDTLFGEELQ